MYLLLSFEIFILWPFCWRVSSQVIAQLWNYTLYIWFSHFTLTEIFPCRILIRTILQAPWDPYWPIYLQTKPSLNSGLDIKPLAARARRARSFKILRALTKFLRARLLSLSQFRIDNRVGNIWGNLKTSPKCGFDNIFDRLGMNTQ